ncbi:hypothetical protein SLEP1_g50423 [Rubroshorea leprosula]|uniref:Uncharacterized protein n=1 Tax=Rubroshorea leprosula TaxID=152421 RepID=A0AAV5LZX7_9ROSI|nr:hypothetical protein SLEP1_g50423 [Rubroshorea leprosula]
MVESSSHAPQISSLPFEALYQPLEMNNPTLPTTIPPLMGQVPAIQPNPSVEILRPTFEDGKSREVDHKLQQLEEALKAMQGLQSYGSIDLDDLCYYPGIQTNFKNMAPYANDERVLIHYFQDSLSGPASVWFSTLDKKKICTFKDVSQAVMKQYEYNMSLAPTRDSLQRITKKGNETFKEFAQRWRSKAAKVIPPLTNSEICSLFIKSTTGTFRAWSRQFTKFPIPYSEVLKQLVAVGLMQTVQANPVQPPYPYGYDPQAKCEYHNVTGHGIEYCTTLKHKIQDLIDEGKLQLDETKSAPSITQNPLPPHGAPTMNMITLNEVDRPILENASSWSLDELFAIFIKYDLIQPIASMSSDVLPVTIDDALVCLITKFIAPVTEEYFTKEKPYILQDTTKAQVINQPYVLKTSLSESLMGKTSSMVMPQHSTILNSTTNDVYNMTRSGRCYVNPELEELRRVALKSKDIKIEEILEESPKKLVSENEVTEFLNILRKSEYSIIEQLNKTLAKISVLKLMLSSEVHLDALLRVLKEAHVPRNIDTQKFETVVGAILTPNYINFIDDEIPDEGNGHTKALHILVQCRMMNVPHVLIDNGSALNVIPMTILKQLKVDESHINQCNTVVRAFDGTKRNVIGKIELLVEIGPMAFDVDFFVMDISPTFNMLLGRPWIHVVGAVPSTLHQKVKYIVNGVLVTCAAASYIHPRFTGKRVEMAKLTKVVARIMLSCHYQLGEGLGLNGQGILEPIEVIQPWGIFGLGYKPKKEDWKRMHAIKVEKHLARLQGRDPRDEPMWVPHIRVTFPRPVEILCPSLDGYIVKHMGVLFVDLEGTVFIDRLLEIGECSKQAKFEEVVVEDITDEVCSDDEEDNFGFNNLFGLANMTDPKERWRRMLTERASMEKHPNLQLIHHAKAPMDPHESVLLETVKEESLCDSWGNLTINALDEEGLEFDRGISHANGSSQANWATELLPDMLGLDPNITVHAILLYSEAKPVKQKLRRMKPEVLLKVKEEIQKLLDVNFMEVAMYPEWVANIVPLMKKDGQVRIYVDYRDLNKASPKDDFPLPHIQILLVMLPKMLGSLLLMATLEDYEPIDWDFPDEDILAVEAESDSDNWKLFFDGAVNKLGCGLGAMLVSLKGDHFPIAIKLDFACTNNIAKYEACIAGIHAALDMNVQDLEIYDNSTLIISSMIQISKDDVIKPLVIEISQEPAHCMEIKVDDKPWFHDIKQFLQNGEYLLYASEVNKKTIRKLATSYFLSENTLYKRSIDMTLLRCVDEKKAKQVMTEVHEGICGTHANGRMLARKILRPGYYWLTMEHDCIKYARAEATSYASVTKKVVTRFIKREIIYRYGQPEAIIIDNESNLNNDMMTTLCKQFKIKHYNSSPYRPKMNGAVEAANKNIKKILAKMAVTYKDWHEMLPNALHAYRTSVRTSTRATPYSLVYGMEAILPIELETSSTRILSESGVDEEDLIQKMIDYLNLLNEKRLATLCHGQCYQQRMAAAYNKKVKPRVFHQGDLILRKIMPDERDPRGKFAPNYKGPYVVKKAFSGGALLLRYPNGTNYHHLVNADAVKMYYC